MALTSLLILLVIVTFAIRRLAESLRHRRNARSMGCKTAPLAPYKGILGIKSLLEMIQADKDKRVPALTEERVNKMRDDNGGKYITTMRIRTLTMENVLTIDPKNIQAVLTTQFKDFCVGARRKSCMGPLLGDGIFTTDGPAWAHSRAMLRPQFTRDQISDLSLEEVHVQNAFRVMPPVNSHGWTEEAVDVQAIFFRLTLDSATELLFGESCESQLTTGLDKKEGAKIDFGYNFDRGQWYLSQRMRMPYFKFMFNGAEFKDCCEQVHRFVDNCIERVLSGETSDKDKQEAGETGSLGAGSEPYVFLRALAAETPDRLELRAQLLNVLLAGRDTTASLLSWTVLLLARHPEQLLRLRREIVAEFGDYERPRNLTFSGLKACTQLQHVMSEVLRLFPPLPMNARYATRDTTLPRGGGPNGESPVYVRKGQSVLYNAHILHRRTDIWGADASEFNPDRWEKVRRAGWEYLPFNGGPRICIGQQFALTEAGYVLVRLLQRFDGFEEVRRSSHGGGGDDDGVSNKIFWGLTLVSQPGESVKVRLHEASS